MANSSDYEVITGLSLADGSVTPQVVYLEVDSDKTCKVVLPDNTVLTSTAGVINTTWAGAAGAVTLIAQKDRTKLNLGDYEDTSEIFADFSGILTDNYSNIFSSSGCSLLTGVSANKATDIDVSYCSLLVAISAPISPIINASESAITAASIALQVRSAILNITDLSSINYIYSGGTNASYATLSAQAQSDIQAIITAGGTVTYNA